jgi:Tol biopolymer transport system component
MLPELTTPDPAAQPTEAPVNSVTGLTLAWDSFFLAPDPADGTVQVWKLPAEGTPAQPFTLSGTDVIEFAASPDGESVVYVVDAELWLQQTGQQPLQLATLSSFAPVNADFSMDNSSLVYADERSGIWINILAEDAPEVLRANGDNGETYQRPQFSSDGSRVLLDVSSSAGLSIGVLDIATRNLLTSPTMPADDPLAIRTHWLRDGRIYSYIDASSASAYAPGIYLFEAPGSLEASTPAIPLPPDVTVRSSVEAVSGTLRVLLAQGSGAFASLRVVDFPLDGSAQQPVLEIGSLVAPRLSPDGRFVGGYESLTQIDGTQQGAILIVDLQTGSRFLLSNPPTAWGFGWAAP